MNPFQASKYRFSIIVLILLLSACEQAPESKNAELENIIRPAKIVTVLSTGFNFTRTYPGTLEAGKKADLAFRVSGEVIALPAQAGLRVKKGQLLARLDDTNFRNSFGERKARYDLAQVQHKQAEKLLKQKLSSRLKFDQSAAELKSAQASLDQARDNVKYTKLLAPFAGIVARVDIQNFQSVQAMTPIMRLQNDTSLDIRFSVPESLISRLKRVDDPKVIQSICGTVSFSAHPERSFKACHKEHESVPDPVTRNYRALFTLDSTSEMVLLPGMTASIEIDFTPYLAQQDEQVLFIPSESVFDQDDQQWVWKVSSDNRAQKHSVVSGRFENDLLEIKQGLSKGDNIIAAGVSFVREGMQVKPLSKERGL